MSPIRIGFIGLSGQGWASTMLAPPLFEEPLLSRYQLTAVSTSNPASAEATAAKYTSLLGTPVKPYHGSPEHIVSDPNVDLVAVSVKVMDHFENAMKVIDGGKDLFLEWPAGNSLKETSALARAAKEKGVRTIIGLQARIDPLFRKVKAIIDSGKIGRILSTSMTARVSGLKVWGPHVSSAMRLYAVDSNGGTLLDIRGGHLLDMLTYILGPVANVSATLSAQYPVAEIIDENGKPTGETIEQDVATQVAVSGVLASRAVMSFHLRGGLETKSDGKAGTPLLWLIDGEKGSIRIEGDDPKASAISITTPTGLYVNGEEVKVEGSGFANVRRAWEAYAAKGEGYADLEAALKTKALVDAIKRSGKEGRRVDL